VKIVFFGTSSFAARILKYLIEQRVEIVAIVTRPDRMKGRTLKSSPPPVKEIAEELHLSLPIYQPEKASTEEFAQVLQSLKSDLFLVVAYGEILKQNLLNIPPKGCVNIHASLLPHYRGAAPMQRALMDGVKETGISIIEMTLQMDAGDILEIRSLPVSEEMTFGELEEKMCALACSCVSKVLQDVEKGTVKKVSQDHALATLAPKMRPEEEEIRWDKTAVEIHNQIRALSPAPGAWAWLNIGSERKRLKIKKSSVFSCKHVEVPGKILLCSPKEGWMVACRENAVRLLEVQLEGKRAMSAEDFLRGIAPSKILSFQGSSSFS